MGGNVGEETEEAREALNVGKVYEAVLLLSPGGPGLLEPLVAPVTAVEEKPPEPQGGVAVWLLVCVAVKVEAMPSVDVDVEFVPTPELGVRDAGLLLLADVGDEGPPPVAVLLEFPYGPVELLEAELVPPVDRAAELLDEVPFEVFTGPAEVTVLFGATEVAEPRVRTEVAVELHSSPRLPQSGLEVLLEVGEDEDTGPVADHPVVGHVKSVVVLG